MSFPLKTSVEPTAGQRNALTFLQPPHVIDRETTIAIQQVGLLIRDGALEEAICVAASMSSDYRQIELYEEIARACIKTGKLEDAFFVAENLLSEQHQILLLTEIAKAWINVGNFDKALAIAKAIHEPHSRTLVLQLIDQGFMIEKSLPAQSSRVIQKQEVVKKTCSSADQDAISTKEIVCPSSELSSRSLTQAQERLSLEETRELIDAGYLDAASDAAKFLITWEQSLVYKEIAEAWIKQRNLVEAAKAAQSIPSPSIQTFVYKEIEKGKVDPLMLDEAGDSARFSGTQGTTESGEFFVEEYRTEIGSE